MWISFNSSKLISENLTVLAISADSLFSNILTVTKVGSSVRNFSSAANGVLPFGSSYTVWFSKKVGEMSSFTNSSELFDPLSSQEK